MEERRLLARTDSDALQALQQEDAVPASHRHPLQPLRDSLLGTIEHELPQEGRAALESLSAVASVAGATSRPEADVLGGITINTQAAIFSAEQMIARAESLESQIRSETANIENLIRILHGEEYKMPTDVEKRNLDLQKTVKTMSAHVSQPQKPSADPSRYGNPPAASYTIHDIIREEQDYRGLLMQKSELESRIAAFRGLPSDPGLAQDELNALRRELEGVTSQRDAAFHGLVQRSSPVRRK
jgi:HAUS augmin-like complex subunit 1